MCLEKAKSKLDMLIKVQLFHHRNNSSETSAEKHKTKERERVRQVYHFSGIQVCRETFALAYGISRKTIESIARSLDQYGFGAKVHGNKGKFPKHALTMEGVKRVKRFLLIVMPTNMDFPYLAGYQISEMRKLFYCPLTNPKQKLTRNI